jgi:2,3-diketo-5-methylthio-1-phosphopentane phosphatase
LSDWTILCDFDGTVALDDTTDTLLESFSRAGWETLEADWRAGRIGSRECMAGQVALLDMSHAEFDAHLAQRTIDPAFADFVAAARAHDMPLEIVSDGLDAAIAAVLGREGFARLPVVSNRLEAAGPRQWRLEFPHASALCRVGSGTCKCARAAKAQSARRRVLLIGDGASDFCVAEAADFVFAKGKLIAHCQAKGIAHAAIAGFGDALALLPQLVAGTLDAASAGLSEASPALA